MASTPQLEPWEVHLNDFLRASETWDQDNDREKARVFVNRLDDVWQPEGLRYRIF